MKIFIEVFALFLAYLALISIYITAWYLVLFVGEYVVKKAPAVKEAIVGGFCSTKRFFKNLFKSEPKVAPRGPSVSPSF